MGTIKATHHPGPSPIIESLINSARRAAYTLLGVGLHRGDGMDPPTALKTITLFVVVPRLIYGLEATILTKVQCSQIKQLDVCGTLTNWTCETLLDTLKE